MAEEKIVYDIDGYDVITKALLSLLNRFPDLRGETISFSTLNENHGIAMFPSSGAVVISDVEDITAHVTQECNYPFFVVYRAAGLSANRKVNVKEWLDRLGCWLEKQPIVIDDETAEVLVAYPTLNGTRKFTEIKRTTPAYLDGINENKSEDWVIALQAQYRNEFNK